MPYHHGIAYHLFLQKWERLRAEYENAGMSEEAIEAIFQFDLEMFNRDRAYFEHLYYQPLNSDYDEDILVLEGVLHFRDTDTSYHSRYWWIEGIDNPLLLAYIRTLSQEDLDIVTMRYFEGFTQKDIAEKMGISQQAVSKRLAKFEKIKKNIKNF